MESFPEAQKNEQLKFEVIPDYSVKISQAQLPIAFRISTKVHFNCPSTKISKI